jgi:hypothetical protein
MAALYRADLDCTLRASRAVLSPFRCLLARLLSSPAASEIRHSSEPVPPSPYAAAGGIFHTHPFFSRESSGGITHKQFSPNKSWVQHHTRVEQFPRARTRVLHPSPCKHSINGKRYCMDNRQTSKQKSERKLLLTCFGIFIQYLLFAPPHPLA